MHIHMQNHVAWVIRVSVLMLIPDEKCLLWIHNFPIELHGLVGTEDIIIIFSVPGLTEQTALDIDILYHG